MLTGSIPAIITPFSNGDVDYDSFEKLLNWQIKNGISGVTVCGTTGESPTLSHDEHMKLVEFAIKVASKKYLLLPEQDLIQLKRQLNLPNTPIKQEQTTD